MANQALAVLESALRDRKLDRTLTTALPPLERTDGAASPGASVPFGIDALDGRLRGGLPRGQLSELAGAQGSGRLTLLLQLMAEATRRGETSRGETSRGEISRGEISRGEISRGEISQGEAVAFVDTCDRLDVASAAAAGVCLDRLLWIRGDVVSGVGRTTLSTGPTWERTLDRAIKALNLVLQAGGFAVVAIDLADVPTVWLKRLPFTTWLRVQRSIEGSDTACVLVTPAPLARSAGGLTLTLSGRTTWTGHHRRLTGLDTQVRIRSPRRRVEGDVDIHATATL